MQLCFLIMITPTFFSMVYRFKKENSLGYACDQLSRFALCKHNYLQPQPHHQLTLKETTYKPFVSSLSMKTAISSDQELTLICLVVKDVLTNHARGPSIDCRLKDNYRKLSSKHVSSLSQCKPLVGQGEGGGGGAPVCICLMVKMMKWLLGELLY